MTISKYPGNPQKSQTKDARIYYLGRYILGLQMPDPSEKCIASLKLGFHFDTPELCMFEMQIVAKNAVKSPDPILHTVFSFPAKEALSSYVFEKMVIDYVDFFHLHNHQIIAGLHADTDNHHIHIMLNRCDFMNDKVIEIEKGFTRYAGSRFSTFLEDKYSLNPSEASASYFVNGQLVLSDLYRLDSAQGRIHDLTAKFGKTSQASILSKIVKPIIDISTSWGQYQQELYNNGIKLLPAKFGGLVFISVDAEGKEIPVACSRVFRGATQKKLAQKFDGNFDPDLNLEVQKTTGGPASVVGPVSSLSFQEAEGKGGVVYGRYSEVARGTVAEAQQVRDWLRGVGEMVPSAEVTFWKPVRAGPGTNRGRRVHMIDRARGDPSPLSMSELSARAENISGLYKQGWNVDLRPSWSDAIVVVGPSSILKQLADNGLFPRVHQQQDGTSHFVFVDVPQQEIGETSPRAYLLQTLARLNIEPQDDRALRLASRGTGLSRLTVEPLPVPRPFRSLISAPRAQVLGDLLQKVSDLGHAAKALVETYVPRLARRKILSVLNACFDKAKRNVELSNDRRDPDQNIRSAASAAGETDRDLSGADHIAERSIGRERAAGDGGRDERIGQQYQNSGPVDRYRDGQVKRPGEGNGSDAGRRAGLHAGVSKAHNAERAIAEPHFGKSEPHFGQPGNLAARAAPAQRNGIASVEDGHAIRMLQSRLLAARNGFICAWEPENTHNIRISGADNNGTFSCLVSDQEIVLFYDRSDLTLSKSNAPIWLLALSNNTAIPVRYPPEPVKPVPPLADVTVSPRPSVEVPQKEPVKQSIFDPRKKPSQLACVFEEGLEPEVDQEQQVVRRFEDLQNLDLSAVERVDFCVSNPIFFSDEIYNEMLDIKEAVISKSHETPTIGLRPMSLTSIAPTGLVFLFCEAPDNIPVPPDPTVCLIIFGSDGSVCDLPEIEYSCLEAVTLHFVDTFDREIVEIISAIMRRRFELLDCVDQIEFEVSDGPLDRQSWMKLPHEDNDIDFGM
jgi:hypothetical protein